jgi:hypothetical protein
VDQLSAPGCGNRPWRLARCFWHRQS